jgi:2-oxoglutarate dehydrogenase E2 component (dihydrolipoamide succinyltransferase)
MEPNRESADAPAPAVEVPGATVPALPGVGDGDGADAIGGDAFATESRETDSVAAEHTEHTARTEHDEPRPDVADDAPRDPADTLSPAVRRLVRQYDLDITGIHGTGPAGRIRVGDVIGMLGGRADAPARSVDASRPSTGFGDEAVEGPIGGASSYRTATTARAHEPARAPTPPATTVFECDLSRVLSHRKSQRRSDVEILLTSYYLVACGEALRAVPEAVAGGGDGVEAQLGVLLASADGDVRTTLVDAVDTVHDSGPLAPFDDRLRSFDQALRAIGDASLSDANLLVHHYGSSGSLLATPMPLGPGHVASVGLGRVRRQIVVKTTDGDEAPRVAATCYVTLTFLPDRLPLNRANRFVAQFVRVLEHWPD